jgi:hypothetical protein
MKAKELAAKLLENPDDDVFLWNSEADEYYSPNPTNEMQGLFSVSHGSGWAGLEDGNMVKIYGEPKQTRKIWIF